MGLWIRQRIYGFRQRIYGFGHRSSRFWSLFFLCLYGFMDMWVYGFLGTSMRILVLFIYVYMCPLSPPFQVNLKYHLFEVQTEIVEKVALEDGAGVFRLIREQKVTESFILFYFVWLLVLIVVLRLPVLFACFGFLFVLVGCFGWLFCFLVCFGCLFALLVLVACFRCLFGCLFGCIFVCDARLLACWHAQ